MADLFSPAPTEAQDRKWSPFVVGLVVVVAVLATILFASRHQPRSGIPVNPYVAKLQLSGLKLSAAENYVGGTVTYFDLNITNTGDRAVTGAAMKLTFKNSMEQVVQTETIPLHVLSENTMGGYPDLVDLSRSPIAPGQTKTVRMTLEHISADWDHSYPEMQLVDLKLK
jgi:hypothetical protein